MTPRRALFALSLVAFAASAAAASPYQSPPAPAPPPPTPGTTPPAAASSAAAEMPIDPIAIAFDVSLDHDAEDAAGPKLLKYVIDFVPTSGAPGKSHTIDLGKPKPVEGSISVPLTKVLVPGTYQAHVRAIGRGLRTSTVTVGPFVITEKIGKTKAEIDKELRAPDKPQPQSQDKKTKKPKDRTQTEPAAAPPQTTPANVQDGKDTKDGKESKDGKDASKPAGKGGFWKKFYGKVVG